MDWETQKGALLSCSSNINGEVLRENICKSKIDSLFNNHTLWGSTNNHKCDMTLEDDPKETGMRSGIINF